MEDDWALACRVSDDCGDSTVYAAPERLRLELGRDFITHADQPRDVRQYFLQPPRMKGGRHIRQQRFRCEGHELAPQEVGDGPVRKVRAIGQAARPHPLPTGSRRLCLGGLHETRLAGAWLTHHTDRRATAADNLPEHVVESGELARTSDEHSLRGRCLAARAFAEKPPRVDVARLPLDL